MRRRTGYPAVPSGTRSASAAARPSRHHDEPHVECRIVDVDSVEAVADRERDALPAILERDPALIASQLQAGPPEDERAMGVVLELVLGVDPPTHADVAGRAKGQASGLRDRDLGGRCQESSDPVSRAVGPEDQDTRRERDETGDDRDERRHGG
jgi:hypothetical protein